MKMSEEKAFVLLIIAGLIAVIYFIYKSVKAEKEKQELKAEKEKYEKEQERKRIKERQANSIKWNKKIQAMYDKEVKTNRPIKALIGDYTNSMAPFTNSVIKTMGIETEVVPSASDVIERAKNKNNHYDIIITNNVYPSGESGDMVLDEIKDNKIDIPVIILTVDQDSRNWFISKGFDEYIEKPIDEDKVIKIFPKVVKNLKFTKIKKSNKS